MFSKKSPQEKERSDIIQLYSVLVASFILQPFSFDVVIGALSLILMLGGLIACYYYKFTRERGSLMHNHVIYLLGSFWKGSLLILAGAAVFIALFLDHIGYERYHSLYQSFVSSNGLPESPVFHMIHFTLLVQDDSQVSANLALLSFAAPVIWLGYRFAYGIYRVTKGYRIGNPGSWL